MANETLASGNARLRMTARGKALNGYGTIGAKWLRDLPPGSHNIRDRLYLKVKPNGRMSWVFAYTKGGKVRQAGLGRLTMPIGTRAEELAAITAADSLAERLRDMLRRDIDPIEARGAQKAQEAATGAAAAKAATKAAKLAAMMERTFPEAVVAYMEAPSRKWKTERYRADWYRSLERHVFAQWGSTRKKKSDPNQATIWEGGRTVRSITPLDVLEALEPIWTAHPVLAARIRSRIELVMSTALFRGWRDKHSGNPATWSGNLQAVLQSTEEVHATQNFASMPYADLPAFIQELRARPERTARALEFLILTAARSGEIRGMRWDEVKGGVWRIPKERMKMKRGHAVPLNRPAQAVLDSLDRVAMPDGSPSPWVFGNERTGKPLSMMALGKLLDRMYGETRNFVTHGFRSSFRDWAGNQKAHSREAIEMSLAHMPKGVEGAYWRDEMLAKKRALLADWGAFCDGQALAVAAE